jgi:hypothetical protein
VRLWSVVVLALAAVGCGTAPVAHDVASTPPPPPFEGASTAGCKSATFGDAVPFIDTTSYCGGGDFALDAHAVYWSPDCASIVRCDRPACAEHPKTLVDGEPVRAIASNGTSLFWMTYGGSKWSLRTCPLDDCPTAQRSTIFVGDGPAMYLAADERKLYFPQPSFIDACDLASCASIAIGLFPAFSVFGLASDKRYLYTCDTDVGLVRAPKAGGEPTRLGAACSNVQTDETDLFVAEGATSVRIAKPECRDSKDDRATTLSFRNVLGVDERDLFFLEAGLKPFIWRVPKHR